MSELRGFYEKSGHGADSAGASVDAVLARELRYPNSTLDAERIVSTSRALRPLIRDALDVGSGHGFFSREAVRQGLVVTAIESATFERTCTKQIAGVDPLRVMFEDYDAPPESFDLIIMSQVLEHAFDVNEWISKASGLIRPGGLLAVALPNFDSAFRILLAEKDPYVTPPAHLNFFGARSLRTLCLRNGFEPLAIGSVSRVPRDIASKRLRAGAFAASLVEGMTAGAFAAFRALSDPMNLGMMLCAYFGKRRASN